MASASYAPSLARLKVHEGGYTDDPRDPGGPTNWGVTIADVRKYINPGATAADVMKLTWARATTVYRREYWVDNGLSCDDLAAGVDDSLFDYRVNSGAGRADKVLRRVCGLPDNASNTVLLSALAKRDPKAVIVAINDERLRFLKSLRTWDHFGKGWEQRVAEVKAFSLQLASGRFEIPTPSSAVQSAGKGKVAKPAVAKHAGKAIAAGAGGAGLSAWHWIAQHPSVAILGAILGVVAVAALVAWLNRRRQSQQEAATPGGLPVPAA